MTTTQMPGRNTDDQRYKGYIEGFTRWATSLEDLRLQLRELITRRPELAGRELKVFKYRGALQIASRTMTAELS